MFKKADRNTCGLTLNSSFVVEKYQLLQLLKIASDENILERLSIIKINNPELYSESYDDEEVYYLDDTAIEIIENLFNSDISYKSDDDTGEIETAFEINNPYFEECSSLIKQYKAKYGLDKALKFIKYLSDHDYLDNISSYCYEVKRNINEDNVIKSIEIILYPDFSLHSDLVQALYILKKTYIKVIEMLKNELAYPNTIVEAA